MIFMREKFISAENEALKLSSSLPGVFRVDTDEIVKLVEKETKYDIKVYSTDFSTLGIEGASDFGGFISIVKKQSGKNKGQASIFLNSKNSTEMMRFSLMHEIGHLMMFDLAPLDEGQTLLSAHIHANINFLSKDEIEKDPYLEAEQAANIFALLVLMPKKMFDVASKIFSVDRLANLFGVTTEAVISRFMLMKTEK